MLEKKWWVQFHKDDGSFNGVAVVRGVSFVEAVQRTHATGCNPGGMVSGLSFPDEVDGPETRLPENTLLSREDLEGKYGVELKVVRDVEEN